MKVSHAWLQTYFSTPLPSADALAEVLMFHAFEVEDVVSVGDDWVLDIDVLPNRSSDCLSHRGIAREIGTLLSLPLARDPLREPIPLWEEASGVRITVDDQSFCARYMLAVVRGVTVAPSPLWLKTRLETVGQRSINAIVDATNYVMLDTGQPLHAFDLAKLAQDDTGGVQVRVRHARAGETIVSLSGESYTLSAHHLLITDGTVANPLAIAGIKGGKQAEVDEGTTDILIEAGHFSYQSVRKTSRELKLATDASVRFQNEPTPQLAACAMRDVLALLTDVAGGVPGGVREVYRDPGEGVPITVTLETINKTLGTALSYDEVERILIRFEWEFSRDRDTFAVTPPWERTDMRIQEDMIEEIGRVFGYAQIPPILPPKGATSPPVHKRQWYIDHIRNTLIGCGYSEVCTYTLTDHGEVELANPLASDKAFLRRDVRGGLARALEENARRVYDLGLETVRIFEIGTVFCTQGEVLHLALCVQPVVGKHEDADTILMRDLATLAETLGLEITDESPQDGMIEISIDALLPNLPDRDGYEADTEWNPAVRYRPWSAYPSVYRDVAVWVPVDTPAEEVLAVIIETAPDTLRGHFMFDTFQKGDRVSYAWHLVFQSFEKTLTDSEVGAVMGAATLALNTRKGWEVR